MQSRIVLHQIARSVPPARFSCARESLIERIMRDKRDSDMADGTANDRPKPASRNVNAAAREARQAAALRDNLRRRKAQARGRHAGQDGSSTVSDGGERLPPSE
jgi:hypothetical protein